VKDYVKWETDRRTKAGEAPISSDSPLKLDIDTVGFSRGAAASREFLNMVSDRIDSGYYDKLVGGHCIELNLRLAALFDTVLSTTPWFSDPFRMPIPDKVKTAVQAIAADEFRSSFPLELLSPSEPAMGIPDFIPNRIERAFVGAHSDIGGGYAGSGGDGGDLSDIALNWMVSQASAAGVKMKALPPAQQTISDPIVHDERRSLTWTLERYTDRDVRFRGTDPNDLDALAWSKSKTVTFPGGMNFALSQTFIDYYTGLMWPNDIKVGQVDTCDYYQWLNSNYGMHWKCP
jgi:hypothetical protein